MPTEIDGTHNHTLGQSFFRCCKQSTDCDLYWRKKPLTWSDQFTLCPVLLSMPESCWWRSWSLHILLIITLVELSMHTLQSALSNSTVPDAVQSLRRRFDSHHWCPFLSCSSLSLFLFHLFFPLFFVNFFNGFIYYLLTCVFGLFDVRVYSLFFFSFTLSVFSFLSSTSSVIFLHFLFYFNSFLQIVISLWLWKFLHCTKINIHT